MLESLAPSSNGRGVITVFGSAMPGEGEADFVRAYELGQRLARAGYTLCNGGSGGTMLAAARGAREAGGRTIGVTMDVYSGTTPNSWLDEEIRVADLFTRLRQLILPAQAYICLRGGCGTLAEWALVWTLLTSGLIPPAPLILLGEEWNDLLETVRARMITRERDWSFLRLAPSIDVALAILATEGVAVPPDATAPLG